MKIFTGTVPENPYSKDIEKRNTLDERVLYERLSNAYNQGQQSILSQIKDVDLEQISMHLANYIEGDKFVAWQDIKEIIESHLKQKLSVSGRGKND